MTAVLSAQTASRTTSERVERLNTASLRRVIEPDVDVAGSVGAGQVVPDHLLTVHGLGLDLTPEQKVILSREEMASVVEVGLRFEAVLMAGFALDIATRPSVTDPEAIYSLIEIGEETRHSRLFARMLQQLDPQAKNPMGGRTFRRIQKLVTGRIISRPALLCTLVLAGEEIPDLIQKKTLEAEGTDPFIKDVNRYHRLEEARHLAFARMTVKEQYEQANGVERFAIKHLAPKLVADMFRFLVHPGVYEVAGLPGWKTWKAVNALPERIALRHEATRPVLAALVAQGVLRVGRIPKAWQDLCGVDRHNQPVTA